MMNASASRAEIETALRAELRARTVPLAVNEAPFARLEAAARRDRIRRRTLFGTTLVLAVALVAAAVPAAVGTLSGGSAGPAGSGGTGGDSSPLLTMAPRGNLVGDTAFIQAVTQRYFAHSPLLYANDDGTHIVVIGVSDASTPSRPAVPHYANPDMFSVLVGPHGAPVSQLEQVFESGLGPAGQTTSYTFVGDFTGSGQSVPYVVLGPADMANVEYATGIQLRDEDGKLTPVRTGITSVPVTDGTAAGEIQDPANLDASFDLSMLLAWHGSTGNGTVLDLSPGGRGGRVGADQLPTAEPYDAIREAVVSKARQDGITVAEHGPGGDEVTDNAAEVLSDLALIAGVSPGSISYSVDWVGRETTQWDSALIEFDAPGLPKIQAFVRGLAPGRPDSESPGLELSFVRPAVPLTPGQLPITAARFGGTSEFTTIGRGIEEHW